MKKASTGGDTVKKERKPRSPSAWDMFKKEQIPIFKAQGVKGLTLLVQAISEKWATYSDEQKAQYKPE
jgi:hypothetical protein